MLLIVDSYAVIHRAYHALPSTFKRDGIPFNAIYGFFSSLLAAVSVFKPEYLIFCFDFPAKNFRHQLFVGYQSKRKEREEDLDKQIFAIEKKLKEAGFVALKRSGYEADDLVGTIVRRISEKKIIIVTGDKDLMQLVDERVNLYLLQRKISEGELIDIQKVKKILGVYPKQVVDYKALVGDVSDNYPGVSGIGPKTAIRLLTDFGNLKAIYRSLEKINPILAKKLRKEKRSAELSKKLAKIYTRVPLKISLQKAVLNEQKILKLKEILKDLKFPSLSGRVDKFLRSEERKQLSLI